MPINKFNSEQIVRKRQKVNDNLLEFERLWEYLSPFQQKKLYYLFMFQVVKARCRKWLASAPAVIGSAWLSLRGDRAGVSCHTESVRESLSYRPRAWVIVPAVYRAGCVAAGVCDLLSSSGMNVIYSLLFLLIFS
jgi:hypothetical protein